MPQNCTFLYKEYLFEIHIPKKWANNINLTRYNYFIIMQSNNLSIGRWETKQFLNLVVQYTEKE